MTNPVAIWADITMTGEELRRIVQALQFAREAHYGLAPQENDPFLKKLEELLHELDHATSTRGRSNGDGTS